MAKPSSSQKSAISFSQRSEVETLSQPKTGSSVSNVVETQKSSKLDFSSLPNLASRRDEVIVRLTALENKLEALVELLSK